MRLPGIFSSTPRGRRASALIVTLGVLALLSLIAFSFTSIAGLESRVSRNYVDTARARMLAQSGIDYALFRLQDPVSPPGWSDYRGEDWNADYSSAGSPGGDATADDEQGNQNGVVDTDSGALRYARRPSFFFGDKMPTKPGDPVPPQASLMEMDEGRGLRKRGFSNALPGTYQLNGDQYVVRVRDTSGQLFVNDRNANLAKIIDTLGVELGLAKDCGKRIIDWRDQNYPPSAGGLPRKELLYNPQSPAQAQPLTKGEYDRLEGYLTVYAWVDTSTVKPKAQSFNRLPVTSSLTSTTGGYRPRKTDSTQDPVEWDYTYRLEPRAPVNINQAGGPMLVALLTGIQARFPDVFARSYKFPDSGMWHEGYRLVQAPAITVSQARTCAAKILDYRSGKLSITWRGASKTGPFGTWSEFEAFVAQALSKPPPGGGSSGGGGGGPLEPEQAAALVANFNPNTMLNKFNPDEVIRRSCDKTDLIYYTNEFCFTPRGYYEIASLGRVIGPAPLNRVLAQAEIRTVVKAFEVMRHTTQKDFMSGSVPQGNPDTRRMGYYPEHPGDRGFGGLRNAGDSGKWNPGPAAYADATKGISVEDPPDSELDGSLAPATKYSQPDKEYWYMQLWDQIKGKNFKINKYSNIGAVGGLGGSDVQWYSINVDNWTNRHFRVRDDNTADSLNGSNEGCFRAHSNTQQQSDPDNNKTYTDLVQDGLLISGDRYRTLLMSSLARQLYQPQAVELWVKPKTNITDNNFKGYWWEQNVFQGPGTFNIVSFEDAGTELTTPVIVEPLQVPQPWWPSTTQSYGFTTEVSVFTWDFQGDPGVSGPQDKLWFRTIFNPTFLGTLTTNYNENNPFNRASRQYVTNTVVWGDPPKPTNPAGPKWYGGQWYRLMLTWETKQDIFDLEELDGVRETQIEYVDPDIRLDGQKPANYKKRRYFMQAEGAYVYLGGYWIERAPDGSMETHYVQINGDPEYGNKMGVGNALQKFDISPFPHAWNGFNRDPMVEGTIDEVRIFNRKAKPTELDFPDDRYWPSSASTFPRYVGQFYRRDGSGSTPVKWDDDATRTLPPQGTPVTIRSVAFTEWRPSRDYDGKAIPEARQPRNELSLGKSPDDLTPAPATWDGREQQYATLIGATTAADPRCSLSGDDRFTYLVFPNDQGLTPLRVAPFFDDITVTYTVGAGGLRFLEWYYAAD